MRDKRILLFGKQESIQRQMARAFFGKPKTQPKSKQVFRSPCLSLLSPCLTHSLSYFVISLSRLPFFLSFSGASLSTFCLLVILFVLGHFFNLPPLLAVSYPCHLRWSAEKVIVACCCGFFGSLISPLGWRSRSKEIAEPLQLLQRRRLLRRLVKRWP